MKRVLAITGTRADYNLVRDLYGLLHRDPEIDFRVLVSGPHLSPTYGHSVAEIEQDGLSILIRLETLIDSDSKASRLKTASLLLQGSIDLVAAFDPDLIVYPGDREDVIIGGLLGAYLELPTMHLFGGDHVQDGHVDNPVRHATSKLSTVHIASTPEHAERLQRMGEPSERIFQTGSPALDRFVRHRAVDKEAIRRTLGLDASIDSFALLIFHPIPEERGRSGTIFESILEVLKEAGIHAFVSRPNSDPGNRAIIEVCERWDGDPSFHFHRNLPGDLFLSIYKRSEFIIGNSSSGIVEAASIPIPAINVGVRQRGRSAGDNVIWAGSDRDAIRAAVRRALSPEFRAQIAGMENPYGAGDSSQRVYELIRDRDFRPMVAKKEDALHL